VLRVTLFDSQLGGFGGSWLSPLAQLASLIPAITRANIERTNDWEEKRAITTSLVKRIDVATTGEGRARHDTATPVYTFGPSRRLSPKGVSVSLTTNPPRTLGRRRRRGEET